MCCFFCYDRLQMLDHFAECVKQAKGVRQQAVQLNIFTAVLSALKVFIFKTFINCALG